MNSIDNDVVVSDSISQRAYHNSIVLGDTIYIVMGLLNQDRKNDIIFSRNGINWDSVSPIKHNNSSIVPARDSFGLINHNNKVYLLGGWNGSEYYNDVYVTSDMINWEKLNNALWSARYGFLVFSIGNKLFVIGGKDASSSLNDIWWSVDGMTWRQEDNAPWAPRYYSAGAVYDGKMIVVGGIGASRFNDIYCSEDGKTWVQLYTNTPIGSLESHTITPYSNKLVLIGGTIGNGVYTDKIYYTYNGTNWIFGGNLKSKVSAHTANVINNKIIVFGGKN